MFASQLPANPSIVGTLSADSHRMLIGIIMAAQFAFWFARTRGLPGATCDRLAVASRAAPRIDAARRARQVETLHQ